MASREFYQCFVLEGPDDPIGCGSGCTRQRSDHLLGEWNLGAELAVELANRPPDPIFNRPMSGIHQQIGEGAEALIEEPDGHGIETRLGLSEIVERPTPKYSQLGRVNSAGRGYPRIIGQEGLFADQLAGAHDGHSDHVTGLGGSFDDQMAAVDDERRVGDVAFPEKDIAASKSPSLHR